MTTRAKKRLEKIRQRIARDRTTGFSLTEAVFYVDAKSMRAAQEIKRQLESEGHTVTISEKTQYNCVIMSITEDDTYCWAVIFDDATGDFWATKKEFTESDREHLGTEVFFDRKQAVTTAKRMNGE